MAGPTIRVLVVDDFTPWLKFYSTALQPYPDLQIIGYVSDGLRAVQAAQELQPDLILLDIGLPALHGIEAARRIGEACPTCKILFVSVNRSADIVQAALSNGAGGYVLKSDAAIELLPAIKAVLEGKRFVSARVAIVPSDVGALQSDPPTDYNPYLGLANALHISEFLQAVINSTAANFAAVQLYDSASQVLRIVAQHGFTTDSLNYFNRLANNVRSACNEAMTERARIVVTDVATDLCFSNDLRAVLLRENVHSLQATPLIDSWGRLVGVISTHYSRAGAPSPEVFKYIDDLATSFLANLNP